MNDTGVLSSRDAKSEDSTERKLRVLFVDDNVESAKLMARTADVLGYDASWAATESEARALLSSQEWDGLVTDWYLEPEVIPGGGGRLAAFVHSAGQNMPCVVITGFHPIGELASAAALLEALGNVVVLHKPQDPGSIMSIIRSLRDARVPATAAVPTDEPNVPTGD